MSSKLGVLVAESERLMAAHHSARLSTVPPMTREELADLRKQVGDLILPMHRIKQALLANASVPAELGGKAHDAMQAYVRLYELLRKEIG